MEEVIKTLTVVVGPIVLFWTAAGIVSKPELFVRMPFGVKAAWIALGAVLVTLAYYLNTLERIDPGIALIGFVLLVAPIAAQLVNHLTLASVPQRRDPDSTGPQQNYIPPVSGLSG
jgi:multisubunit Na+/H+ antiporter MnhG subunit